MSGLPDPPTPAEADLRDFPFLPLDVVRLRDSDLAASVTGEEFRAAVLLWCASWHQIPAGSLPDDDAQLSHLSGFGRVVKEWKKVKTGALHKWFKCSDGRLYHNTIAEKVGDGWTAKLRQQWRTECARIRKHNERHGTSIGQPEFDEWRSLGCRVGQPLNVTRDIVLGVACDTPPLSQGQSPIVARDIASNRQGEGQGEGEGQGNIDSSLDGLVGVPAGSQDRRPPGPIAPRRAKRAKPRSEIAEDAQPTGGDCKSAEEAGLDADRFRAEWRKFRDFHRAKGSLMADWSAAWRTWLGNIHDFQRGRARHGPSERQAHPTTASIFGQIIEAETTRRKGIFDERENTDFDDGEAQSFPARLCGPSAAG